MSTAAGGANSLERPRPIWERNAGERFEAGPPEGDLATELAIVGGGFTGLSTALHAAERGVAAHVFEAGEVGFGGSGRNVGLVNAGVWLPPQQVRRIMGDGPGGRLIGVLGAAPAEVFALIDRYGIRCDATRTGTIHAAHSPHGYADLRGRAAEWQRLGAPVELLDRAAAARMIGSPAFHGGLWDHRAGTLNPVAYVRGLARAAVSLGAKVSTGVRIMRIRRDGDFWRLESDAGNVKARSVVLATNAYTDGLWPGLRNSLVCCSYFQVATEPLGARGAEILPGGQGVWDTGRIMVSVRRDAAGRLLLGSMGRAGDALSRRWANAQMRRLFPDLGQVRIETAWDGAIAMTPDHLPRIHRLADGVVTPIGYNGRGVTTGTVFGRAVAEMLAGAPEADLPLPLTRPGRVWAGPVRARIYDLAFTLAQWQRGFAPRS